MSHLAVAAALVVSAHPPSAAAQSGAPQPTFRASAQLVQLDVTVTDGHGRPVTTLTRADFEVEQDGRRQVVRFVEYVAAGSGRSAPPMAGTRSAAAGAADDVTSAEAALARVAIVVDDRFMSFDSIVRTREALATFVADSRIGGAPIAIVGSSPPDARLEFTGEPERLREQIARLGFDATASSRARDSATDPLACSTPALSDDLDDAVMPWGTMSQVDSALRQLRRLPGRKALFLVSDGISWCADIRFDWAERLRRVSDLANRSSTVVYIIQTRPWSSGATMPETRGSALVRGPMPTHRTFLSNAPNANLRELSERTGGFAARSNDIGGMLHAARDAHQGYYLLAYEPPPKTFGGDTLRYRSIRVKVRGKGLRVRARAGFYNVDRDQSP